ncbi:hypothetical protein SBRCBS47491_009891 [Sporothrix bragantina]|uniref:Set domain containing protein n=1 Tax=Sporothrix bragantina TaxID=671064 RepID=A0ABP0CYG7_9PEZI
MAPRRRMSEVIDLTDEAEDEVEIELEITGSTPTHKPRPPPLSREPPSPSQGQSQTQSQAKMPQSQHYATIYREGDAVPTSSSFGSPPLRTTTSSSYQATSQASRTLSSLDILYGRQHSTINVSVNRTTSGSSNAAAASNTPSPARSGSQQSPTDRYGGSIYGRTSSSSLQRPPSGQSSASPRPYGQPTSRPAAESLSTRPAAPGSSDYNRAQSGQSATARPDLGSTPGTPNMNATSRSQASPTQPSHSWMGRSPPLSTGDSQQQQPPNTQPSSGTHNSYRPLSQSFSSRSALASDLSFFQRHTMSLWDDQVRDTLRLRQRTQEAERQQELQRQAERQRVHEQYRRQEQQRQLEQQEQRRVQEQQRMQEQRRKEEEQKQQQRQQEEKQKQQHQEELQRLQRLQRQQQQQQHQHLANAHAQAQAHQAQTQQQHRALHHSASTSHLHVFGSGQRSPPLHSPQHSPLLHPATSGARWSTPLATAGGPQPSLRPSATHPLPNPATAGFRSASAGIPSAWQSSHSHLHTPHHRNSPLHNSPPSPTLPPVQTKSPPHPYGNPHLRQLPGVGRSPSLPSAASPSPRPDGSSETPQQAASQRPQQQSTQHQQPASSLAASFSLRKSPPRDMQTLSPRPPSTAAPAAAQTHTHSPSRLREPLWSSHFTPANRPAPAKESSSSQQRPAASTAAAAHQEAGPRPSWAGTLHDTAMAGYPSPSPPLVASSSSPLSTPSSYSSSRPGSAAAASVSTSNANAVRNSGGDRTTSANTHAAHNSNSHTGTSNPRLIDFLPDRLRLRTSPFPQSVSHPASSANSPAPPSPSPSSPSSFPELRARAHEDALRQNSSPLGRNAHRDVRLPPGAAPAAPILQEVTRQDALLQNETLQADARRADQSEETVQIEVFQAEARRVDALQASVLLQEARRAEAMQAAEAQRAEAMQVDAIREEVLRRSDASPSRSASANRTPEKARISSLTRTPPSKTTPKAQQDWTVAKIASSLEGFLESLLVDHGRDVELAIDMIKPRTRPVYSSFDDFAEMPVQNIEASDETTDRVLLRGKLHRDNQRRPETRTIHARVLPLKSPGQAVPKYRFHHVEIAKNILSPNTPLKFIPHLRDFEDNSDEKRRHDQWIEELESMERKSGFDSSKLFQKGDTTRRTEFTKLLSEYLDHWIARLGIDNCSKTSLIRYMANESQNDQSITPQQKNSLLSSCGEDSATPRANAVASMLTEAFNRVFESRDVTLYDVLKQDEAVENVFDPKKATKAKDQDKEPSLEQIQQYLGTYTSLKCMICNTHSCEHGEFDAENVRRCFSIDDLGGKLWKHVERRRDRQIRELRKMQGNGQKPLSNSSGNSMHINSDSGNSSGNKSSNSDASSNDGNCKNKCYRTYDIGDAAFVHREWTENETNLLRSFHLTFANSTGKVPCALCPMMGRYCWEVYRRAKELGLHIARHPALPALEDELPPPPVVKPVTWYDRQRKTLNGDWSDHTYTHFHALREQREPCNHDGPCTAARGCPCVEAKLLCERFCRCTAESCAFKFTGCNCHGTGKTCYMRQKEGKPCICVQLNRECDPVLCGGCGARERADPENRDNDDLHSSGCQNVSLQRGKSKAVVLGQSQLQGCGYGLFTAEDIGADEFIIEYIGELITHDEGVRREARRGDFFDQGANASYLFTLLEQDGIWVDAAIYGNLSRYINHASESDKRGCNITPKILYVNGEFRIRFTAMRDIKAGEELFFNYGENFPNLTKKLLEDKASASDDEAAAATNTAKSSSGSSRNNSNSNSRRSAASRSNSNRRKNQNIRSRAPTKTVQSGPSSNRAGGGNNSRSANNQRRARPRGGARKEAPPADVEDVSAADDDSDDDGAVDHMDIDGGNVHQSRRTTKSSPLKRKRRAVYDDEDGDDESDEDSNERSTATTRKRDLSDDEDHGAAQSRRNNRSSRRRPGTSAPTSTTAEPSISGLGMPETPRRLRARLNAQQASHGQSDTQPVNSPGTGITTKQEDPEDDDDIPLAASKASGNGVHGSPRNRKRRAATRLSSSVNGTYTDGDVDTDEQPLRKRPRIATRRSDAAAATAATSASASAASAANYHHTDSDNMVVDSDESLPMRRPLRSRRTRQQNRVTELLASELSGSDDGESKADRMSKASSPVVLLGTTDDDQGSVFSASQPHGRRQTRDRNQSQNQKQASTTIEEKEQTTTSTPAMSSRSRRNVVPDSDDDMLLSASQASRSRRAATLSQATVGTASSSAAPGAPSSSQMGMPLSRPHTPKAGGGSGNSQQHGVGGGSSRRSLRSDEARPDSSSGTQHISSSTSQQQQRTHSTPVTSRPRSAGGGDDESGASSVDRSQRKRQMPARYRTDE